MLQEVFVIYDSILQYHYSKDQASDNNDQAVLSSGLLSAIRDFSSHARADALESFSTENEYFLFTACDMPSRIIVGVFDRRAPNQVARESLDRIKKVISEAGLPDGTGEVLTKEKTIELRDKIDRINTQLFGRDGLARYIEEILSGRTDIPLAFLIDANDKSVLAHFARPRPLYKETQVREFLLLHSTLQTALPKIGLDPDYRSFKIESSDYTISSCRGGRLLSVASGAMRTPSETVQSVSFQMCYDDDAMAPRKLRNDAAYVSESILFNNGIIKHESGNALPSVARIFLSTLINNIDSFFNTINRRKFTNFEVTTGNENQAVLEIQKSDNASKATIRIYQL